MLVKHKLQKGVSLLESMIALLVISIGLLGIAALQVTSMKQNNSALHHSQAVWIGYNIADRIRANLTEYDSYAGTSTEPGDYDQNCSDECTAAQMVVADQADWTLAIQNLPGGLGTITNPPGTNELLIKVKWDDEGTGASGTSCSGGSNDLTCYTVTLVR